MKAVEHFEYTKGFRFSTFAHRIISQNIHLAVEKNDGTVRRPFKLNREKIQADQARIKLEQTLGRPLRSYDLKNVLPETLEYRGVHIQDNVEHTANDAIFLSPIPAVEDHSELDEQQQQAKGLSTYYESKIQTAVEKLDARSAMIVRLRYGIGINKDYTLKEVSDLMQLSAERVRQISLQAIQRISNEFES
jgi:RNA polymerase sigma factor (sigma-70 family)